MLAFKPWPVDIHIDQTKCVLRMETRGVHTGLWRMGVTRVSRYKCALIERVLHRNTLSNYRGLVTEDTHQYC